MKLEKNQQAPTFSSTDIFGNPFDLSQAKGQKILLSFMRFAGCPVCNFRVHQLLKSKDQFKKNNIQVVLIYESEPENLREYVTSDEFPFTFIADPKSKLYDLYSVERSFVKLMISLFKGMIHKAKTGKEKFKKKIQLDGSVTRMGAEFVMNRNRKILVAHYANFLGDELPVKDIINS